MQMIELDVRDIYKRCPLHLISRDAINKGPQEREHFFQIAEYLVS